MKCCMVAGEKSGDKQGSLLIHQLLLREPDIEIFGLGGSEMHAQAAHIENWADEAAVVGLVDVLKKIGYFKHHLDRITQMIVDAQPDALILIDYPGFNQRLAERIHRKCPHTRVIWFIAPMVWAWHKGRLPKLARICDLMLCTFPFEKPLFDSVGLDTEFIGHPLVDDILASKQSGIRDPQLIGLFPGSRRREVERIFPVFLEFVQAMNLKHPEWKFETSASSPKLAEQMHDMREKAGVDPDLMNICPGSYHDLMDRAQAALVTSGTATLEAALHELPFALVYKVAPLTYWVGRMLLTIKYLGMVNILIDRPVTTELIQHDFTIENCQREIEQLLDPASRQIALEGMAQSVATLGHGGAASKAAEAILDRLHHPRPLDGASKESS